VSPPDGFVIDPIHFGTDKFISDNSVFGFGGTFVFHGKRSIVWTAGNAIFIYCIIRIFKAGSYIKWNVCFLKMTFFAKSISGKKGFVAVNIDKDKMNSEVGFCRKALQAFEENGISIEHMPSGIDTMTVFVHQAEFEGKEQQVISSIRRLAHPDIIDLESDLALIAVVGRGMKSNRGTAGRIFSALAHANINVRMIDQGSSELNIIIGVSNDDFDKAIKAIYDIFVVTQL